MADRYRVDCKKPGSKEWSVFWDDYTDSPNQAIKRCKSLPSGQAMPKGTQWRAEIDNSQHLFGMSNVRHS